MSGVNRIVRQLRTYGPGFAAAKAYHRLMRPLYLSLYRRHPTYRSPTADELVEIEERLNALGQDVLPLHADPGEFIAFQERFPFPIDYHGGRDSSVWDETLLEHFLAFKLAGVERLAGSAGLYVDVAAANSPWTMILRNSGYTAEAIDLTPSLDFNHLPYYKVMDATRTDYRDSSVSAMSLQCAFEMFTGRGDIRLIQEARRILAPGGRLVILPLYMHTHPCGYATPEYFGRDFEDAGSSKYLRVDTMGVRYSRKYSPETLVQRILETIENEGMSYKIYRLSNKQELGRQIYCHFILQMTR